MYFFYPYKYSNKFLFMSWLLIHLHTNFKPQHQDMNLVFG